MCFDFFYKFFSHFLINGTSFGKKNILKIKYVFWFFLQIFFTVSHKRHVFRKKHIEHKIFVLIFSTNLSETFLTLRGIERDMIINARLSTCKVPVILVRFQHNLNLLGRFSKKKIPKISNFKKIPAIGAVFVPWAQTDMTKLVDAISNFCNAPIKETVRELEQHFFHYVLN